MEIRNMGMFSIRFTVPTLMAGRKWFTSMPMPVKPPETTLLGIRYIW